MNSLNSTYKATLAVAFFLFSMVNTWSAVPDFAFPKTVAADAEKNLKTALNQKNSEQITVSVIQLIISDSLLQPDSVTANIKLLDNSVKVASYPWNNLLILLKAKYLESVYDADRYTYNKRTLPLNSKSDNPLEWSADQFSETVYGLLKRVNNNLTFPDLSPLGNISGVLTDWEYAAHNGWTIGDFIFSESLNISKSFCSAVPEQIPFFTADSPFSHKTQSSKMREFTADIADNWVAFAKKRNNDEILAEALVNKGNLMSGSNRTRFFWGMSQRLKNSPSSLRLLSEISPYSLTELLNPKVSLQDFYAAAENAINAFPDSPYRYALQNSLTTISTPEIIIKTREKALPGDSISVEVVLKNISSDVLLLKKLKERGASGYFEQDNINDAAIINRFPVMTQGEKSYPYSDTISIKLPSLAPERYALVSKYEDDYSSKNYNNKNNYRNFCAFEVSGIDCVVGNEPQNNILFAYNAIDMTPIVDATVSCVSLERQHRQIASLKTDADGSVKLPEADCLISVKSTTGNWSSRNYYNRNYNNDKITTVSQILTNRSICKPGDSIAFVAVVYNRSKTACNPLPDEKVKFVLKNVNSVVVDSLYGITDRFGRCDGSFKIPDNDLSGRFTIEVLKDNDANGISRLGAAFFDVAEYKRPSFLVTIDTPANSFKIGETVEISGSVTTWTGVSPGECEIDFNINTLPRFWRYNAPSASFAGVLKTDNNGRFTIKLPTSNLKKTPYADTSYRLSLTATSPGGESQAASDILFSIGESTRLNVKVPEVHFVKSQGEFMNIKAWMETASGEQVNGSITYTLKNYKGEQIKSGAFIAPSHNLDVAGLPSARYELVFNNEVSKSFILIDKNEKEAPSGVPLWIPNKNIIPDSGVKKLNVRFGTDAKNGRFLCQVSNLKGNVSYNWIDSDKFGMGAVEVETPSEGERTFIRIMTSKDFNTYSELITVYPPSQADTLKVKVISFRDKIVPGNTETWKFKFRKGVQPADAIAAVAVMSDKSLNMLAPFKWNLNMTSALNFNPVCGLQFNSTGWSSAFISPSERNYQPAPSIPIPAWNFYGQSLYSRYGGRSIMVRGNMVLVTAPESMMRKSMSVANDSLVAMGDCDTVTEESESSDSGSVVSDSQLDEQEIKFRESEYPVAWFKPDLVSDSEGCVEIEFQVPDFNTTWQMQLAGYDKVMDTALLTLDAVSSKPLMISLNVPRFVRTGDNARLVATVYNKLGEKVNADVVFEVFNLLSGGVVANKEWKQSEIDFGKPAVFNLEYPVSDTLSELGVRCYVKNNNFSDGEQYMIPVLPSSVPVIDAMNFYLQTGIEKYEFKLLKLSKDSNVTFSFSGNPVWYILSSLSSLRNDNSDNLLTVLNEFYANTIATGLVRKDEKLNNGLKLYFNSENRENDLVSPLSKSGNERLIPVDMTPWINNAEAETERFESLKEIVDSAENEVSLNGFTKFLASRQDESGLMMWLPGFDGSQYMTLRMLGLIGKLNRAGFMNDDSELKKIIRKSVSGVENYYVAESQRNNGEYPFLEIINYLLIRSNLELNDNRLDIPAYAGMFNALANKALGRIESEWKDMSLQMKARLAILLQNPSTQKKFGKKKAENLTNLILKSLKEFSTSSPEYGVWYEGLKKDGIVGSISATSEILEAFAAKDKDVEMIDGLRQWLILQRRINEWGSSDATVSVVNAILSAGFEWLSGGEKPVVKLNGEEIEIPEKFSLTSSCVLNLNPENASGGVLTVERSGKGPAWGAVTSQYVEPIREVKPRKVNGLSVKRSVYPLEEKNGILTPVDRKELKVGDKVRVTITLETSDNMSYVTVSDLRSASMEPVEQLSGLTFNEAGYCYRETRNDVTNFFFQYLPAGTAVITYDCYVSHAGDYSIGITDVQSAYAPSFVANSRGEEVTVIEKKNEL